MALIMTSGLTEMFTVPFICIYASVSIDLSVRDGSVNTEIPVKIFPKR